MALQSVDFYKKASIDLVIGEPDKYVERLHGKKGYLDLIEKIYFIPDAAERKIKPEIAKNIDKFYKVQDAKNLLLECLKLSKFPFNHPYIGLVGQYYKKYGKAIELNEATITRLGQQLLNYKYDELMLLCKQPIDPNRAMGQMFKNWLDKLGTLLDEDEFLAFNTSGKIAFLKGDDNKRAAFARKHLNYRGDKGLDIMAKKGAGAGTGIYILGEAKWVGQSGGKQNDAIKSAINLLNQEGIKQPCYKIAVLDGFLWIPSKGKTFKMQEEASGYVFSALFLLDFLKSIPV